MRIQDKRRGRATIAVTCAMAATVAVVVAGCSGGGSDGSEGAESIVTPSASPTRPRRSRRSSGRAVEAVEAIDTSDWTTYTSDLYDLEVGHPPGWTETPATRKWRLDKDGTEFLSPAHEAFRSPEGDVRVSVWAAPLDPSTREETTDYLEAWVEDYCEATENIPCTGIDDRAVELCLEKRDCHPGLLVPFQERRPGVLQRRHLRRRRDDHRRGVAPRVGLQRGAVRRRPAPPRSFLSTMEVWPAKP